MQHYPEVKEESITDRLLYDSLKIRRFKAHAFSRREEAGNGADWEWWVIVNRRSKVYAYRFLIQAKRIKKGTRDCYGPFNYKDGDQLQTLLDSSHSRMAMPLYMVYTVEKPDFVKMYRNCKNMLIRDILLSCKNCKNGAFLTPARYVEELLMKTKGKTIDVEEVLNKALKLSFLDCIIPVEEFGHYHPYYINRNWRYGFRDNYTRCNEEKKYQNRNLDLYTYIYEFPGIIMKEIADYLYGKWWNKEEYQRDYEHYKIPFCYLIEDIPGYVKTLLFKEEKDYEQWYEQEFRYELEGLAGVAILDLSDSVDIPDD